jgi:hypothetical protein
MRAYAKLALPVTHIGPAAPGTAFGTIYTENLNSGVDEFIPLKDEKGETFDPKKVEVEMLPPEIKLTEDGEKRLINYLISELSDAESERQDSMHDFARWRRKYRTKFPEWPKDWPIANSSQITIPVIKTAVHTLTSRVYQTVMAADPILSYRTKNEEYQDFAINYEEFFGLYCTDRLDLEDTLDTVVTETIKLGTAIVEVTTKTDKRALMQYDGLTKSYKKIIKEVYNGPIVYHFPIEDFWCRIGYQDIQTAPWCGKEIRVTWSQIKDMALSGELNPDDINKVWKLPRQHNESLHGTRVEEQIEDREPMDWQQYRLFELSVRWDVDGDGLDEELLVYFHWESRTLLRRKFNTFRNGRRPWIVFRYLRVPHRLYGEGMAEILEHLQEEISTIHNQRIDNATVANLQIILVKKLIRGLSPGDRLWSGKIVKADAADVGTLRLGEIYPSTVNNEQIAQQYAKEISGVGDNITGSNQPVTRTTATAQLSMLEEANRRFDKPIKSIRKSVLELGKHCTDILADYGTYGLAEAWLGDEKGRIVEQGLADPRTFEPGNVRVQVKSTKSSVNREVEFQSAVAVMNMVVQMGQQFMQLAQMANPQAAGVVAHELVQALREPWKKVMQYSDSQNTDEALSVLNVLSRILPSPEDLGGMAGAEASANAQGAAAAGAGAGAGSNGQRGASQGAPGADQSGGLAALLAAAGGSNGAKPSVATGRRVG